MTTEQYETLTRLADRLGTEERKALLALVEEIETEAYANGYNSACFEVGRDE